MSEGNLSSRGVRIVKALEEFADDVEAGVRIGSKYKVRTVEVDPKPSPDAGSGAAPSERSSG